MDKTPNLDAMAAASLRLDRFYAGAPASKPAGERYSRIAELSAVASEMREWKTSCARCERGVDYR